MAGLIDRVVENRARVEQRIAEAGGDLDAVTLVAVTKGFGVEAPLAAVAAGLRDVGENYAQELEAKAAAARTDGSGGMSDLRWHFLGGIQRNKIRRLAPLVHLWHSVDRVEVAEEIARRRPGAAVLVQVNLSGEPQKGGCSWEDLEALVARGRELDLAVRGLMGVAPAGPAEAARPGFRRLAEARRRLGLAELSIGMSGDLEVAVEEGATIVRVGTALFGPRPASQDL